MIIHGLAKLFHPKKIGERTMNRQEKIREQHRAECIQADCQFCARKCISLCGKDCIRLGGTKIPVHRLFNGGDVFTAQATHGTKAYFINDGWASNGDEGRE